MWIILACVMPVLLACLGLIVYAATKVKQKAFFVLFYSLESLSFLFGIICNFIGYWIVSWVVNRDFHQFCEDHFQF